jgi:hypothetical protein
MLTLARLTVITDVRSVTTVRRENFSGRSWIKFVHKIFISLQRLYGSVIMVVA